MRRVAWLSLWLIAQPLSTAVIVVDDGCALVDAVRAANNNVAEGGCVAGDPGEDTILLARDVVMTEGLPYGSDGTPEIVEDLTIDGDGFSVTRDSLGDFRFFRVGVGVRFHSMDLSISGGYAFFGGAVYSLGDTTFTRTVLSDNTATDRAGAIYSVFGSLTLVDSTISGNTTFGTGAGIWSYGDVFVRNSTLTANSGFGALYVAGEDYPFEVEISQSVISDNEGDGVVLRVQQGEVSIRNSTISGNSGVGIRSVYRLSLQNSTVSGNAGVGVLLGDDRPEENRFLVSNTSIVDNGEAGLLVDAYGLSEVVLSNSVLSGLASNCSGNVVDAGGNFGSDESCGAGVRELVGLDPILADNGGATLTHALLPASSAIDGADDCGLAVDQRGFGRDDGACDSGAFEFDAELPGPVLVVSGSCPGRVTFSLSGGAPNGLAAMVYSADAGADPLLGGPCAGTASGLVLPQLLASFSLDAGGGGVVSRNAPSAVCGRLVQMVDGDNCTLSEVVPLL